MCECFDTTKSVVGHVLFENGRVFDKHWGMCPNASPPQARPPLTPTIPATAWCTGQTLTMPGKQPVSPRFTMCRRNRRWSVFHSGSLALKRAPTQRRRPFPLVVSMLVLRWWHHIRQSRAGVWFSVGALEVVELGSTCLRPRSRFCWARGGPLMTSLH